MNAVPPRGLGMAKAVRQIKPRDAFSLGQATLWPFINCDFAQRCFSIGAFWTFSHANATINGMRFQATMAAIALLGSPVAGHTQDAGATFEITASYRTTHESEESSGSSGGKNVYLEEILAVRADGVEKRYSLPTRPDRQTDNLANWQFPVRVLEKADGTRQILNREDMETRRDAWLNAAEISKDACGAWYFTWNAFQVECDPDSILLAIDGITIQPMELHDGAMFAYPGAQTPAVMRQTASDEDGKHYQIAMLVDPDTVRKSSAESDMVVGQIMKNPISFEEAYAKHQAVDIAGTITVLLDAKPDGRVWRRTVTTNLTLIGPDGETERQTSTQITTRLPHQSVITFD